MYDFLLFSHTLFTRLLRLKEDGMEKFTAGLALGMLAGALVVANSYKVRTLVKKGQDEMKEKLDEMIDEKMEMLDNLSSQKSTSKPASNSKKAKA